MKHPSGMHAQAMTNEGRRPWSMQAVVKHEGMGAERRPTEWESERGRREEWDQNTGRTQRRMLGELVGKRGGGSDADGWWWRAQWRPT